MYMYCSLGKSSASDDSDLTTSDLGSEKRMFMRMLDIQGELTQLSRKPGCLAEHDLRVASLAWLPWLGFQREASTTACGHLNLQV